MIQKLIASRSEYIDPAGCGSTVGYKIVLNRYSNYSYFDASMNLSDCNRLIQWEFGFRTNRRGRYEEMLSKLDRTIGLFQEFRAAIAANKPRRKKRVARK